MSEYELTGLVPAKIIKRYKRFLADVELEGGEAATAHCTNTGAMATCWEPGDTVLLQPSRNPARKLPFTWIASKRQDTWIGVETGLPNRIVAEWLKRGAIAGLEGLSEIRQEVPYGNERSRIDIWAIAHSGQQVYIEVKNTTLRQGGTAFFPDAKTERGAKHLRELRSMALAGHRAVILFFINRGDVSCFAAARHIDPKYADELDRAANDGVTILPLLTSLRAQKAADGAWSLAWQIEKILGDQRDLKIPKE
jgi:sugar fermentation stimulation protein A